ncbi:MAG: hypothetical protein QM723_11335 [Myxococcaceae bacterium]
MAKTPHSQPPPLPHRGAVGTSGEKPVPPGLTPKTVSSTATTLKMHPIPPQVNATAHAQVAHAAQNVRAAAHQNTEQHLQSARSSSNQVAQKLSDVRVDANAVTAKLYEVRAEPPPTPGRPPSVAEHRIDRKVLDLICAELRQEPGIASKAANQNGGASAADRVPFPVQVAQAHAPNTAVHAAQAVELIEKIEVFVKSQRPALALTLNNSLGARVEIERIGPREVALKVVGAGGIPPNAEDLGRIREEMKARGLKVGALSVG